MRNEMIYKQRLKLIITICILLSSAALGLCFLLMSSPSAKDFSQAATNPTVNFVDPIYGTKSYTRATGSFLYVNPPASTSNATFNGWQAEGDAAGYYSGNISDGEFKSSSNNEVKMSPNFMSNLTSSSELAFSINIWITMEYYEGGDMVIFSTTGNHMELGFYDFNMELRFFIGRQTFNTSFYAYDIADGNWHMLTLTYAEINLGTRVSVCQVMKDGYLISDQQGGAETIPNSGNFSFYFGGEREGKPYGGEITDFGFFSTPITSEVAPEIFSNSSGAAQVYIFGKNNEVFNAIWDMKYTLSIDANGGSYSGATSISQTTGSSTSLYVPTKDGYKFKGWAQANVTTGASVGNVGSLEKNHTDPFLKNNADMYYPYNNAANGNIVLSRTTKSSDLPSTYNSHILKISNIGTTNPGLGGYVRHVASYANAEFYTVIQAEIPIGYRIEWASNATGDGGTNKWLTPTQGTGQWENYVYYLKCGSTGSFSSTNFFYLIANSGYPSYGTSSSPIEWYVANSCAYDATGMGLNPNTYVSNMSKSTTYKFGSANQTLVALWESDTWDRYAVAPTLNADGYYHVSTAAQLAYFAKLSHTQRVSANIKLTSNIDLSAHRWMPIGNNQYWYSSAESGGTPPVFDGNNYKITGLNNFNKTGSYQGLFGNVYWYSIIKNVSLSGEMKGNTEVGGLIGSGCAVIQNCDVNVKVVGLQNVGGVVGKDLSCQMTNVTNFGSVSGNYHIGGLSGNVLNNSTYSNCRNVGNITGGSAVGGIVGFYSNSATTSYFTIEKCFVDGTISGASKVGGLIGDLFYIAPTTLSVSFVLNCVNANIISTSTAADSGGLIGLFNFSNVNKPIFDLKNCYFNGSIQTNYANFGSPNAFIGNADLNSELYIFIFNSITQIMADTYANVNLKKVGVATTIKAYARSSSTFTSFSYANGVNDGLPVQSGMFWIGGIVGQNVSSYLQSKGFVAVSRR